MSNPDFPNGFIQCSECGAQYDSLQVYVVSHSAPDYEWVGECGHARLKWKNAPRDETTMPEQKECLY